MISYLKHNQIDKVLWDRCIAGSLNRRIYGFSWYLDIVCPGWEALVDDDYRTVFALTWNRKYGISYLYQPYFAQQLGPFSIDPLQPEMVSDILHAIPATFRFAEISLNSGIDFPVKGWKMIMRMNHEMSLNHAYEDIRDGYAKNTKRNLKKAENSGVSPGISPTPDQLIDLFSENFGKQEGKLKPVHYQVLHNLINYLVDKQIARISGIFDDKGSLSAAACLVNDDNRYYFLFAASSREARDNGAMFMLIDRLIRQYAENNVILDFEGGNDASLARFYQGFGAREIAYPALRINNLPAPVRWSFSFYRKLRQS
jgi:hypothetical protein